MAIPRLTSQFCSAGIVPMPNGDHDVPVPKNATVQPDRSRTKEYVTLDKGTFRTSATLKCPCLYNGRALWGWYSTSFTNAFEGPNALSCPTQTTYCDPLAPPNRPCQTTDHSASASQFSKFTKD